MLEVKTINHLNQLSMHVKIALAFNFNFRKY